MPMIGARFYAQIDHLHVRGDILENELAKVSVHRLSAVSKRAHACVRVFSSRNSIVLVCFV